MPTRSKIRTHIKETAMTIDEAQPIPTAPSWLPRAFHAFLHRDFSILWFGMLISGSFGSGQYWLLKREVVRETHVWTSLDTKSILLLFPFVLLAFRGVGGFLSDRMGRRNLLLLAQLAHLMIGFCLLGLKRTDLLDVKWLLGLLLLNGAIQAIAWSAFSALTHGLVPRERLLGAVAFNDALFLLSQTFSGMVFSAILTKTSENFGFLLEGMAFLVPLTLFLFIDARQSLPTDPEAWWTDFADGVRAFFADRRLWQLSVLVLVVTTLGSNATIVVEGFMDTTPKAFWFLMLLVGATTIFPAIFGGIAAAGLGDRFQRPGILFGLVSFFGVSLIVCAFIPSVLPAVPPLLISKTLLVIVNALALFFAQSRVANELQGRLMSVFFVCWFGGMNLSPRLSAVLTEDFEPMGILLLEGGVLFLVGAILLALTFRKGSNAEMAG